MESTEDVFWISKKNIKLVFLIKKIKGAAHCCKMESTEDVF
jgi:hypothetical protein